MELDLKKAIAEMRKRNAKKVALQVPEGLKTRLAGIVEALKKEGIGSFSFVDPCFGACDLRDFEAKELGADLLLHFGHTKFVEKEALETVYIPILYKASKGEMAVLAEKAAKALKEKGIGKVGICSTIQYRRHLEFLDKGLRAKGFEVFLGKPGGLEKGRKEKGPNAFLEKGQVLGCNYSLMKAVEGKVDAVVFLGDGLFHPLGLSFAVGKKVFLANPEEGEVKELETERDLFLRKRIAMVEKARQAKTVGIWVSSKRGQSKMVLAQGLKKKFEEKGKKAFVIVSDFVRPEYIAGMGIEAVVCTACPRIALDDSASFKQPVVTGEEALAVLGEKKAEHCFGF